MSDTKIMIVEDEGIVAKDLSHRLRALGYTVTSICARGGEAIQKAGETRPNLVLMDVHLADEIDGVQAAGAIRSQYDIPVIYLTAYADSATLQRAKITEPFGYILKPFEERELQTNIEMALHRHRSDQALRESERRFRELVESSQGLICTHDLDGVLMMVNPASAELLGYTPSEMVGHSLEEYIVPEVRPVFKVYLRRIQKHHTDQGLLQLLTRDGQERVLAYRNVLLEETGRAPYVLGHAQDITKQQRQERELRVQNEYMNAVHDTTLGMMSRLDLGELLESIITRAAKLAGTPHGYIFYLEPGQTEMVMRVGVGHYQGFVGTRARSGVGLAGTVWQTGEALAVDDYRAWPGRLPSPDRDVLRAVAGVPLKSNDQVVGVIGLAHLEEGRTFREAGMAALARFAELASIALDNARLYHAMQLELAERKKAQEALRESEDRYRDLFENASDLIQSVSPEGRYVYVNRAWKEILGYSDAELTQLNLFDVIHPDEKAHCMGLFQRLLCGETLDRVETIFVTKDGRLIQVEGHTSPRMENGQMVSTRGIFRDVTERRKAETALRESETKHRVLMNSIQSPVLALTREMKVLYCNNAYARMLRATPNDLEGKSLLQVYPDTVKLNSYAAYEQVLATGTAADVEGKMDGRYLHSQVFPTPWGILAVAEDVTERKQAEEQRIALERKLLETQKLESLGVLAGGIAHDFNNLLVSILGNVGLVLLDLEPYSPVREPIEQIKVASQRAADLTKQMLAYSGRGRFVMQRINLNQVVQEMAQLLQVSISKSAVLRFNLAENLPAIEGDATQVRQVVMNLILNASDAVGERQGVITLNTGVLQADQAYLATTFLAPELPAGHYVFLEVADTGVGMDEATLAKIFEPFFTTKFTGRGLGLAAVMGIVRGHKGAIKVTSSLGKGSVFRVLLPSAEALVAAGSTVTGREEKRGMGTVLVIDDEEVVRTVTKRMLERYGFKVLQASDGRSGLEAYRADMNGIDIVLLDMTMPHMSGQETFQEIKRFNPDAKVLLMSGYTEQEANSRFQGQGLSGFLQKPYTPQELNEKVQQALESG